MVEADSTALLHIGDRGCLLRILSRADPRHRDRPFPALDRSGQSTAGLSGSPLNQECPARVPSGLGLSLPALGFGGIILGTGLGLGLTTGPSCAASTAGTCPLAVRSKGRVVRTGVCQRRLAPASPLNPAWLRIGTPQEHNTSEIQPREDAPVNKRPGSPRLIQPRGGNLDGGCRADPSYRGRPFPALDRSGQSTAGLNGSPLNQECANVAASALA
jgi:hypothetical protein